MRLISSAGVAGLFVFATGLTGTASGQFQYDEAIDGDLTDVRSAPDALAAAPGANTLIGTVVSGDIDYFRFTVPAGFELSAINLVNYDSPDFAAFLGIQAGSEFTVDPADPDPSLLLGYALYGPLEEGTDLLPSMGTAFGAIGFAGALPSGEYSFWNQQTGPDLTAFEIDFVITQVPAPAGLVTVAGAGLLSLRRRR